jgi:hypothetical protein
MDVLARFPRKSTIATLHGPSAAGARAKRAA